MKIVGFMVTGREAHRYLRATLEEFKRLCDDAVIATNNADQETKDLISEFGFWQYEDNREWGKYQPDIKTALLGKIARLKPDWVLPLDSDEVFSPNFTRSELEELCSTKARGFLFYLVNLWNDENHYWSQGSFWNVRLFRFDGSQMQYLKKNVHCGLAPPYAYKFGRYAPYVVKHYGLMKKEDRDAKIERYNRYDPHGDKVGIGSYYEAIRGEGGGRTFILEDVERKVVDEVSRMNQDFNKEFTTMDEGREFVYVKRKKDGKILDIPKSDLEQTLKSGGFEFVSNISMIPSVPKEVPVERDELMCPLCDKVFSTEKLLKMHKGRFHK